jgi:hypothetical protein
MKSSQGCASDRCQLADIDWQPEKLDGWRDRRPGGAKPGAVGYDRG